MNCHKPTGMADDSQPQAPEDPIRPNASRDEAKKFWTKGQEGPETRKYLVQNTSEKMEIVLTVEGGKLNHRTRINKWKMCQE